MLREKNSGYHCAGLQTQSLRRTAWQTVAEMGLECGVTCEFSARQAREFPTPDSQQVHPHARKVMGGLELGPGNHAWPLALSL